MDKSILDMVHESAKDLHAAGVMKETTLREFDALCLPPVKIHCSVLAEDAIKSAIKDYRGKHDTSNTGS